MLFTQFIKQNKIKKVFDLGRMSQGLFFVNILEEYGKNIEKILLESDDDSLMSYVYKGYVFKPVLFLMNVLKMGFSSDYLVSNAAYLSVFDEDSLCSTNLLYTLMVLFKELFKGLTCEVGKIRLREYLEGKNKKIVYWSEGKIINNAANIGLFFPFLVKSKMEDTDDYDDDPFIVSEQDNVKRCSGIVAGFRYDRIGSVLISCDHVKEKTEITLPIISSVDELKEENREKYVTNSESNITEVKLKEKEFKNGTKNAISILHFIDYYRNSWSQVENIYVIGVASNPHLLDVARFFTDKRVIYVDPMPCYEGYFGDCKNAIFLQECLPRNYEFEKNSVLISDIRTNTDDKSVDRDNRLQIGWAGHRNVLFGTYKFRYPFVERKNYRVKYDFLFLQAFKGSRSNETRMYISKTSTKSLVASDIYDEKICYFNNRMRFCGSSCNDCRLREYVLSKYVILPQRWASMFNFLSDREYEIRNDVVGCAHDIIKIAPKYLNDCISCNWRYVNDKKYVSDIYERKGFVDSVRVRKNKPDTKNYSNKKKRND